VKNEPTAEEIRRENMAQKICDILQAEDCTFEEAFSVLDQAAAVLRKRMESRYIGDFFVG